MEENKENIPKIRFPGFEEEWEQRKLGKEFYKVNERNDGSFGKEHWISVAKMYFQDPEKVQSNNIDTRTYVMRFGDIAFEGHPNQEFKFGRFVANDIGEGVVSELFPIYRHKQEYDNDFWKRAIQLERMMAPIFAKAITSSGNSSNKLDEKHFLRECIPVPAISEQKQIGTFFRQLDKLITLHHRKLEHLQDKKNGLLQKMFPKDGEKFPEVRFPGFTEPWKQCKFGEVIDYIVDNRGKNPKYYCESGIPVIDNYMIKNTLYPDLTDANRFLDENIYENFIRKYNKVDDILITLVGNGIGNITLFPADKAVIIQNTLGLRTSENKRFIFFLLMSKNREIITLDRGMAQPSIRQDEVLDIEIQIPNLKEQDMIGACFSNLDNLITLHQRKLEHLQQQKKGLLQQMFI